MPSIISRPKQVPISEKVAIAGRHLATKAESVQLNEPSDAPANVARGRLPVFSEQFIPGLLQLCDAAIIGLSGAAAYAIYAIYKSGDLEFPVPNGAAMAMMVALFIYLARVNHRAQGF